MKKRITREAYSQQVLNEFRKAWAIEINLQGETYTSELYMAVVEIMSALDMPYNDVQFQAKCLSNIENALDALTQAHKLFKTEFNFK